MAIPSGPKIESIAAPEAAELPTLSQPYALRSGITEATPANAKLVALNPTLKPAFFFKFPPNKPVF